MVPSYTRNLRSLLRQVTPICHVICRLLVWNHGGSFACDQGANFTPDNSVITVDVFNAWTKRHPGAVEAAFYMAPKPGDGIEDDSITVTVANGAVVRAYPPEWEHLVKLARSICDGLYIVRVVASSLR